MRFDAHTHVFGPATAVRAERRYVPAHEAAVTDLLAELERHEMKGALLVQTSFARNPDPLLAAAHAHPGKFRVVASPADLSECERAWDGWLERGVVGIRLNLLGRPAHDLASPAWRTLGARMADAGVHLEVHAEGREWDDLTPALLAWPSPVVIDHLGRPETTADVARLGRADHVWFKASAPYRWPVADAARAALDAVVAHSDTRIVWGSDWPHTQHEASITYGDMVDFAHDELGAVLAVSDANLQRLLGSRAFPD